MLCLPDFCFDCLQPRFVVVYYLSFFFLKVRFLDCQFVVLLLELKPQRNKFAFELKLLSFISVLYDPLSPYFAILGFLPKKRLHRASFDILTCIYLLFMHASLNDYFFSETPLQKFLVIYKTAVEQRIVDYISLYPACLLHFQLSSSHICLIYLLSFLMQLLQKSCLPGFALLKLSENNNHFWYIFDSQSLSVVLLTYALF